MSTRRVEFRYRTGLARQIFRNARLRGSWDGNGHYSDQWTETPMADLISEDGCPAFEAAMDLDVTDSDQIFNWGVVLDGPQGANFWGIPTEVQDAGSTDRYRQFRPRRETEHAQIEEYFLTYCRQLGANKHFPPGNPTPGLRFAVWAPNARAAEVVFGLADSGYIHDDGRGVDPSQPLVPLQQRDDGIWESPPLSDFAAFAGLPYMYRIVNAQDETVYRTDLFSRHQIGRGEIDPAIGQWPGTVDTLDGTVSCSVVVDPDATHRDFAARRRGEPNPRRLIPDHRARAWGPELDAERFWASEFDPGRPVPSRVEDLIIYELHVGGLGTTSGIPGDLADALTFLDHLVDLGVNAVELLPMAEFSGTIAWGYGDTHHFVIESSAGGRDEYRHFVRECHRRGIAVIQDVVYNHYDGRAERAQWQYDATTPEQNIYYWYEGRSSDYPGPDGGYLDNGSSGFAPRYSEEIVRQQFISSAAFLLEEMHVDGLRVDLTQAIHRDNSLHVDGRSIGTANVFGQKLLREWSRTLRMIRPSVMLIAEDHSGWNAVTQPPAAGGLGFDATWYADFYHHLIGDADAAGGKARLLKQAGTGGAEPLVLDQFSGALSTSQYARIVYHESHDEAGNARGSARTVVTAVNHSPLVGATRIAAEARSRVVFGLTLLSAGTPMFFMGEEIGAQKPYTYDTFLDNREDIIGERSGPGAPMFRYYQEIIALSRRLRATRGQNLHVLHQSNDNRVIAFKRWNAGEAAIVVASFNNEPFAGGYAIASDLLSIPDVPWKEIFNSDAAVYGGANVGNGGASIASTGGRLDVKLPANGLVIFAQR
jgi:1,4-alpha-glucan branching enzyme